MDLSERRDSAAEFWRRGYVILRSAFARREMDVLRQAVSTNAMMNRQFEASRDKFNSGKYPSFETIFVWNDTSGDDLFAKLTRSYKIMGLLEAIFDDEVYVYHNKVTLKYSGMPGFKYHQDYNYWYKMGCLFPDMATCFVAIDPATRRNGCLKLVEGSHRLGRIEHVYYDGVSDSGADPKRLEPVLAHLPERHMELAPGDAVIFHCNTLHASDANLSTDPRLALLGCYNTRHNDPFIKNHPHPNFVRQTHIYEAVTEADVENLPDFALSFAAKG